MRGLLPVLVALVGCAGDRDHDGARGDDCDDRAPFVYPGAPDDPQDGVDADCDGVDPEFAFLGEWSIDAFSADYAGYPLFLPGTGSGLLTIPEDLTATLAVSATLDPAVAGTALPIDLTFTGAASPIDGPGTFTVYGDTVAFDEQMHVELDCQVLDDELVFCAGELKALEASLDTSLELSAL